MNTKNEKVISSKCRGGFQLTNGHPVCHQCHSCSELHSCTRGYPRPTNEKFGSRKWQGMNPSPTALVALISLALFGCAPEFDDPTMSIVKKPEILSVVLEPPEAAPGDRVRASFLMADDRGVIEGRANVWMPMGSGGDPDETDMGAALGAMGLELESLGDPEIEFTVPPASSFVFDEDGLTGQMLGLFAATGDNPGAETPVAQLLESLDSLVESGDMKSAFRTLVVSEREARNQNPTVLAIRAGTKDAQNTPLDIVRSSDEDIEGLRQLAADNPLEVTEGEEIYFAADVEDDSDLEVSARYQWISTGGDFQDLRERVQPFEAPKHEDLEPGDVDWSGLSGVDPRTDPNLRPVWLIVRDNGLEASLGQAWAEFYVRVKPE